MSAARRRAAAAPKGAAARVRADLAACYRLVAHFGMTDLIYTHVSARTTR